LLEACEDTEGLWMNQQPTMSWLGNSRK